MNSLLRILIMENNENLVSKMLKNSLVAGWNFEEPTGSTRGDVTNRSNNLLDSGGVETVAGRIGNAVRFIVASSQYLYANSTSDLSFENQSWSMAALVKLSNTNPGAKVIASKYNSVGNQRGFLLWYLSGSSTIQFVVFSAGTATPTESVSTTIGPILAGVEYMIYIYNDVENGKIGIRVNLNKTVTKDFIGGTYSATGAQFQVGADLASNFFDGDINWLYVWKRVLSDTEQQYLYNHGMTQKYPFLSWVNEEYPIWNSEITRDPRNPVITTADTGTGGDTAADPYLFTVNGKLYIVFESTIAGNAIGREYMAESLDGITWTNFVQVSTINENHHAHPMIYLDGDTVHLYMQSAGGIAHRSSTVAGFPNWGAESSVFNATSYGWVNMNEFEIFQHTDGNYYMLGITDNDRNVRGLWSSVLPTNWNTQGSPVSASPLISVSNYPWIYNGHSGIVEITRIPSRMDFIFGVKRSIDGKKGIGVYRVDNLSTSSFSGHWLGDDQTFFLGDSGSWDDTHIHRLSVINFNGQHIGAYDAEKPNASAVWKIGFVTKP